MSKAAGLPQRQPPSPAAAPSSTLAPKTMAGRQGADDNQASFKVIIIGAGPQALALASHLLEPRSAAHWDPEDDKALLHHHNHTSRKGAGAAKVSTTLVPAHRRRPGSYAAFLLCV